MSHVASVECVVRDLDALRAAADRLGFEFLEGQRTYRWYGRFLNDWPSHRAAINKGVDPATFGRCDHALRLRAAPTGYEVGVTLVEDGRARLTYDSFGQGKALEAAGGVDMVRLLDETVAEVATRHLEAGGYQVTREQEAERITLTATR